ncbi:MAG: hypothetical protein R2733_10400 [Acidimicrobiales bacterium]
MHLRHLFLAATTGLGLLVLPAGADAARCTISGTSGDDVLVGTEGPDVICAGDGDDTITALGGDDIVYGGAGWDTINGGDGNDTIYLGPDAGAGYGDAGNDRIVGSRNGGYGKFDGGDGDDVLIGLDSGEKDHHDMGDGRFADNLFYTGAGDDRVYGSSNADYIESQLNDGFKRVWARAGDDIVFVLDGRVEGESGDDVIVVEGVGQGYGGSGNDWLYSGSTEGVAGGGTGADYVSGLGRLWAGDDDDVDVLEAADIDVRCGGRSKDVYIGCTRS